MKDWYAFFLNKIFWISNIVLYWRRGVTKTYYNSIFRKKSVLKKASKSARNYALVQVNRKFSIILIINQEIYNLINIELAMLFTIKNIRYSTTKFNEVLVQFVLNSYY